MRRAYGPRASPPRLLTAMYFCTSSPAAASGASAGRHSSSSDERFSWRTSAGSARHSAPSTMKPASRSAPAPAEDLDSGDCTRCSATASAESASPEGTPKTSLWPQQKPRKQHTNPRRVLGPTQARFCTASESQRGAACHEQ
jgi:hypothetical protein